MSNIQKLKLFEVTLREEGGSIEEVLLVVEDDVVVDAVRVSSLKGMFWLEVIYDPRSLSGSFHFSGNRPSTWFDLPTL